MSSCFPSLNCRPRRSGSCDLGLWAAPELFLRPFAADLLEWPCRASLDSAVEDSGVYPKPCSASTACRAPSWLCGCPFLVSALFLRDALFSLHCVHHEAWTGLAGCRLLHGSPHVCPAARTPKSHTPVTESESDHSQHSAGWRTSRLARHGWLTASRAAAASASCRAANTGSLPCCGDRRPILQDSPPPGASVSTVNSLTCSTRVSTAKGSGLCFLQLLFLKSSAHFRVS